MSVIVTEYEPPLLAARCAGTLDLQPARPLLDTRPLAPQQRLFLRAYWRIVGRPDQARVG
jgi:hypothetical protein